MSDTQTQSVFHDGELYVQNKLGVAEMVAKYGPKGIRTFMPDQHREFYAQLPMIFVGALDREGVPWASAMFGEPGFVSSPNAQTLAIGSTPLLHQTLGLEVGKGAKLGLLGLELGTRRRNRVNGYVASHTDDGFEMAVDLSFGNCPKYIQRYLLEASRQGDATTHEQTNHIATSAAELVKTADMFFIASRTKNVSKDTTSGVDVSHRGGKPGFVNVNEDGSLSFPDFSGNRFFNTLGNIATDSRVGLFFPNFTTGEAVYIAGDATIVWGGNRVDAFEGAERIVDVTPTKVIHAKNVLPLKGKLDEASPFLKGTGDWAV